MYRVNALNIIAISMLLMFYVFSHFLLLLLLLLLLSNFSYLIHNNHHHHHHYNQWFCCCCCCCCLILVEWKKRRKLWIEWKEHSLLFFSYFFIRKFEKNEYEKHIIYRDWSILGKFYRMMLLVMMMNVELFNVMNIYLSYIFSHHHFCI